MSQCRRLFTAAVGAGGQTRSRCTEARARAIQLDRADPEGHIFIPVCQRGSASLYRTAQCHAATGYCWCVDEITGIPIPGFSTRDVTPNCTQLNIKTFKGRVDLNQQPGLRSPFCVHELLIV